MVVLAGEQRGGPGRCVFSSGARKVSLDSLERAMLADSDDGKQGAKIARKLFPEFARMLASKPLE